MGILGLKWHFCYDHNILKSNKTEKIIQLLFCAASPLVRLIFILHGLLPEVWSYCWITEISQLPMIRPELSKSLVSFCLKVHITSVNFYSYTLYTNHYGSNRNSVPNLFLNFHISLQKLKYFIYIFYILC